MSARAGSPDSGAGPSDRGPSDRGLRDRGLSDARIIETARVCLMLHGPAATTPDRVAAMLGAPRETVRSRYPGRRALQAAVVHRDLEASVAELDAIAADAGSPADQLAAAVRGQVRRAFGAGMASGEVVWGGASMRAYGGAVERLRDEYERCFRVLVRGYRVSRNEVSGTGSNAAGAPAGHDVLAARAILQMTEGIAGWFRAGGAVTATELEALYVGFALAIAEAAGGNDARQR